MLAVCYDPQYLIHFSGSKIAESNTREYGRANFRLCKIFFKNINQASQIWMNHSDTIKQLPINNALLASTNDAENATYKIKGEDT